MESCGTRPLLGTDDRPFALGRRRDRDHHHGWMSDEKLIARLRELVLRGEYRDDLYGRPGENLDGASALRLDGAPDAWGSKDALQGARREYRRGSPDYQAAKAAGLIDPLPPLERATSATVEAAEHRLGASLPPVLRRLYIEIGNGGFGPGYGILGLDGGFTDDRGHNALEVSDGFRDDFPGRLLLALCHWGCAIYSLVDLDTPDSLMWGFDPNGAPDERALFCQGIGLSEWLERWIDGRLHQPVVIEDPETGELRGATDAEIEQWADEVDS